MPRANRVLVLGTTGVDKATALRRLAKWLRDHHNDQVRLVDFERDWLWNRPGGVHKPEDQRFSFLNSSLEHQRDFWSEAWSRFVTDLNTRENANPTILSLHGCFVRGDIGARCVFRPGRVAEEFKPDIVITLVDDVYNMWWRTEDRADRQTVPKQVRPNLEQLILARRQELMIGDLIGPISNSEVVNLMLSVNHPIRSFVNAINFPKRQEHDIVYLSFPISQPVRMAARRNKSGKDKVSAFIRAAYAEMEKRGNLIIECPLAIDELPLKRTIEEKPRKIRGRKVKPSDDIAFDRKAKRWSLDELCVASQRLGVCPDQGRKFPRKALQGAAGSILTDVSWRDYRLVDQAHRLVIFNPIIEPGKSEPAGSVMLEYRAAFGAGKTCWVYQDAALDPKKIVTRAFDQPDLANVPTMEPRATDGAVVWCNSMEDLIDAISSGGNQNAEEN